MKKKIALLSLFIVGLAYATSVQYWIGNKAKTGTYYSHGIETRDYDHYLYVRFRLTSTPPNATTGDSIRAVLETRLGNTDLNGLYSGETPWESLYAITNWVRDTTTINKRFAADSLATVYPVGSEIRFKVIAKDTITADTTYTGDSTWQWTTYIGFQ